jgi:hypothetical protein
MGSADQRATARSVLLLLLAVFTGTMCGLPDNTDSECEFQTTSALARGATFALGGTPEGDAMVEQHDIAPLRHGVDGRWYSWFGVGQALVGVPFYGVGRLLDAAFPELESRHGQTTHYGVERSEYFAHLLVGWRNPLLSALTGWLVVLVLLELESSRRSAWLAGMSYGLASFAWAQARSTLSDVQATFFLFAACALLLSIRRKTREDNVPPRGDLLCLGLCLGMAFLTRSLTAPALAVVGLAAVSVAGPLARARGIGPVLADAAWAAAPAIVCLAFYLWTNTDRFGDPFESGYGEPLADGRFFSHPIPLGLAGLLLSPGKGLVWTAPLVLLAPLGAWRAWRSRERLFPLLLVGTVLSVFLPVSMMSGWHGAWTYGPRYVLPALPFLWVAAWLAFDGAPKPRRLAFGALAVLGIATSLPAALVDQETHQELAVAAAEIEWADTLDPALAPGPRGEVLFQNVQWDWRLAAPWAHWRILRHRLARQGETFSSRELFFLDRDETLTLSHDRQRGFRHLAWVDLKQRLDGPGWVGWLISISLLVAGAFTARRALA